VEALLLGLAGEVGAVEGLQLHQPAAVSASASRRSARCW
jgi:hypothetical protein